MGLWQLFCCVSRGPSSTLPNIISGVIMPLSEPLIALKYADRTTQFVTLLPVMIFFTWFDSSGPVTEIYLSSFSPPHVYHLSCRRQFTYCKLPVCVAAWCVGGKQHSRSFSALGGGQEPLASRGQPAPAQSVGLRARQAGQLPAVTL